MDFREKANDIQPLIINGERVTDFRFLGVNTREDLTWGMHTDNLVKKAQKGLYNLRVLRKNSIPENLLVSSYH